MNNQKLGLADPQVAAAIGEELGRQRHKIELIASENFVSPAVMEAMGTVLTNKYAEGYPGHRYYGGCEYVDKVEELARQRACELFGAEHANVQPHCGANANLAAFFAFVQPGDTVMGMNLSEGGHLSHGSPVNISGKYFHIVPYGVDPETERIDYDKLEKIAEECRPKMIIGGASAYPRIIDFERMAAIAHKVGAFLMIDMAHIAGLVAAGLHPSPVPYADVVTTTTHKTLRGPRGGMILCPEKYAKQIDKAVFPGTQGGPLMHIIAAKAVALGEALKPEFKDYQKQIIKKRRCPGGRTDQTGSAAGFRRYGQPSGTGGYPVQRPHRQGSGTHAGCHRHHLQQEHHPQRPGQPLCDQRHPSGCAGCHHPGIPGRGLPGSGPDHRPGAQQSRERRRSERSRCPGGCPV